MAAVIERGQPKELPAVTRVRANFLNTLDVYRKTLDQLVADKEVLPAFDDNAPIYGIRDAVLVLSPQKYDTLLASWGRPIARIAEPIRQALAEQSQNIAGADADSLVHLAAQFFTNEHFATNVQAAKITLGPSEVEIALKASDEQGKDICVKDTNLFAHLFAGVPLLIRATGLGRGRRLRLENFYRTLPPGTLQVNQFDAPDIKNIHRIDIETNGKFFVSVSQVVNPLQWISLKETPRELPDEAALRIGSLHSGRIYIDYGVAEIATVGDVATIDPDQPEPEVHFEPGARGSIGSLTHGSIFADDAHISIGIMETQAVASSKGGEGRLTVPTLFAEGNTFVTIDQARLGAKFPGLQAREESLIGISVLDYVNIPPYQQDRAYTVPFPGLFTADSGVIHVAEFRLNGQPYLRDFIQYRIDSFYRDISNGVAVDFHDPDRLWLYLVHPETEEEEELTIHRSKVRKIETDDTLGWTKREEQKTIFIEFDQEGRPLIAGYDRTWVTNAAQVIRYRLDQLAKKTSS